VLADVILQLQQKSEEHRESSPYFVLVEFIKKLIYRTYMACY